MRKHAAWYLKGVKGNSGVRNAVNECDTREQLVNLLYGLVEEKEGIETQSQVG
jgi:tRNA-dihydrouridine synthase